MSKTVKKEASELGIVSQVREAFKPKNRLATCMGCLLGGLIPLASFVVAHWEVSRTEALWAQTSSYLVLGGLAYSAKTVFAWGRMAFQNGFKALGFVVLTEGVLVSSHMMWLAYVCLAYLMVINGIATGCNLTLAEKASK